MAVSACLVLAVVLNGVGDAMTSGRLCIRTTSNAQNMAEESRCVDCISCFVPMFQDKPKNKDYSKYKQRKRLQRLVNYYREVEAMDSLRCGNLKLPIY